MTKSPQYYVLPAKNIINTLTSELASLVEVDYDLDYVIRELLQILEYTYGDIPTPIHEVVASHYNSYIFNYREDSNIYIYAGINFLSNVDSLLSNLFKGNKVRFFFSYRFYRTTPDLIFTRVEN